MTKQEAINTINASFPSIWSKDDVLQLINKIDEGEGSLYVDKEKLLDKIKDAVESGINGMSNEDIVDMSECEFDIRNGNEIVLDSFGVNTSDIVDNVMSDVENAIDEYVEEIKESQEA